MSRTSAAVSTVDALTRTLLRAASIAYSSSASGVYLSTELFPRLGIKKAESFEHIHGLVEASKRALALRDRVCTDFDHLTRDPGDFLKPAFLDREAATIRFDAVGVVLDTQGELRRVEHVEGAW